MTVKLTLEFDSIPDLLGFFQNTKTLAPVAVVKESLPTEPANVPTPEQKRKPGRPPKNNNAQPAVASNTGSNTSVAPTSQPLAEGVAGEPVAAETVTAVDDAATVTPVTLDDARKALTELNARLGLEKAKDALLQHGANRLSELAEDRFESFVNYCKSAT